MRARFPRVLKSRSSVHAKRRFAWVAFATVLSLLLNLGQGILPGTAAPTASAHNLNASAVYVYFDPDTQATLDNLIATNQRPVGQPLLRPGDELGLIIKAVPDLGTTTGVGGYTTFYIPNGVQVVDAAYIMPGDLVADGITGFDKVPMKGQAQMPAVGAGGESTVNLVGVTRGPNILGVTSPIVTAANLNLGTLPGVYGDTGIFYSTAPETAYGTYTGGKITNNSGDEVGLRTALGTTLNKWDAWQMAAYGISGTTNPAYPSAALVDSNQRGYAPWGLANVVAGPQSGYAWGFNFETYSACDPTPTGTPVASCIDQATQQMGPWQRIKYQGSQFADDPPGARPLVQPYTRGADASNSGWPLATTPLTQTVSQTDSASPKAIRWAIGQLTYYQPEYVWVKIKVHDNTAILDPTGCPKWTVDTFGGDAGGDSGGKDHIWRYYDPNSVTLNGCLAVGKPATRELVKVGDYFQYKIKLYNAGGNDFSTVQIQDTLPSGATYVSAVPAPSNISLPNLTWTVAPFLRSQMFEATVTVKASSAGLISNNICTTGQTTGGQTINSCGKDITVTGNQPLLRQSKNVSPTSVAPGGTVQYTISMLNIGSGPTGSPIVVTEYLPTGFTYVSKDSVTINGANVTASTTVNSSNANQPVFTVPGAINAGQGLELKFTAQVSASSAAGSYCNSYKSTQNSINVLTGALACVTVGGGQIGDTIYRDWDGDGSQDAAEEGIAGVTVKLYAGDGTTLLATTTTDADGHYLFAGRAAGSYVVEVNNGVTLLSTTLTGDPDGTLDNRHAVTLATNQQYLAADFGYQPGGAGAQGDVGNKGNIGDRVFEDVGNDGFFTAGVDTDISGVTVYLYADRNGDGVITPSTDALVRTTTTNASGVYGFSFLGEGYDYIVKVADNDPALTTYFGATPYQASTVNPHPVDNLTGSYLNADFGYWRVQPGTIGDTVFADVNGDGLYTATIDSPLANVTVSLLTDLNSNGEADAGEPIITTSTTVTGYYSFGNLGPGAYVVTVNAADPDIPGGYVSTVPHYDVTLAAGENYLTADFPFVQLIAKTVSPAAVATVPATLTYTITVNYPTEQLLSGVVVTDAIPISTTYVANSINASGYYTDTPEDGGPAQVVWDLGSNEPGLAGLTAAAGYALCPVVYTTVITQDTWIEQEDPTRNNGDAILLLTKPKATQLKYTLLGPDVSGIPGGSIIRSAKLYMNVQTNRSNHFDKVYTLKTAWTEGSGTDDVCGAGNGNGATWNAPNCTDNWAGGGAFSVSDYYTNTVGILSPSTKGYKSVDVSAAVNSWVNQGVTNRGLVLVSTGTDGGDAKYYSEENTTTNTDPYLRVVYLVQTSGGCGGTTTLESAADTFVNQEQTTTNNGAVTTMSTQPETNKNRHALVQWDLATIAPGAVISSTVMTLTVTSQRFDTPQDHIDQVRRMNTAWTEAGATWNTRDGTAAWAGGGAFSSADYGTTSYFTITQPSSNNTAVTGTLTSLVNDWINNGVTNNGIALVSTGTDNGEARYGTKENGTTGYRPKLTVNWWLAPNEGATTVTRLRASPMLLGSTGQVRVTMEITASATVTNVTPPADLVIGSAGGASAAAIGGTKISGPTPTAPITITAGGVGTFVWVYEITPNTNPDGVVFTGRPTAPGTTTSFAPAQSNSVLVVPALTFQVRADAMPPSGFVSNTAKLMEGNVPTDVESPPAITAFGASIGDRVWADLDGDGVQDTGEPGIPDVQVCATPTAGGAAVCATTDASGAYRIYGLTNLANYTVTMNTATSPAGYQPTTATSLVRTATTVGVNDADFGLQPPGTATIGDTVWLDANNNGSLDGSETGLPGITVRLYASDGTTLLATTTTNASGVYTFTGLNPATYQVRVDTASVVTTTYGVTSTLGAAMAATVGTVNPKTVTVTTPGQVITDADFGYNWSGSIGDYVWYDDNLNGLPDEGAGRAIAGATVLLYYDADGDGILDPSEYTPLSFMDTNSSGIYTFGNLPPGDYLVDVYEDSFTVDGNREAIPTTPDVRAVNLAAGQAYTAADFGYYDGALVEGHVFWDADRNGVFDGAESGLTPVGVSLTGFDTFGNPVSASTTTDASGKFAFIVPEGTYTVTYSQPNVLAIDPTLGDVTTPTSYTVTAQAGPDWHVDLLFGVDNIGKIGDTIWNDSASTPGDGVYAPLSGETGLANVTVNLFDSTGALVAAKMTDANGNYLFEGLASGVYVVSVVAGTVPAGLEQTGDPDQPGVLCSSCDNATSVTLTGVITQVLTADFGYRYTSGGGQGLTTLRGYVYQDLAADGGYAVGTDPLISGATIRISCGVSGTFQTTTTASGIGGNWNVAGVPEGATCTVTVITSTLPSQAYVQTGDPDQPGVPCSTCDSQYTLTVPTGGATGINFGYHQQLGGIGGTVVIGPNANGIADAGETPLQGVTITLLYAGADGFLGTGDDTTTITQTNASGTYSFTNLLPGLYQVVETNLPTYLSVADRDGGNPDNITVNLAVGQNVTGRDFEDVPPPSLAASKTLTAPSNGIADVGDTITFTLRVTNTGQTPLSSLIVTDAYDAGKVTPTGYSVTPNGQASGVITWTTNLTPSLPLAAGAGLTLTVRFHADAITTPGVTTNTVTATGQDAFGQPVGPLTGQATVQIQPAAAGQIGDRVWWDINGDGSQDAGEPGIAGVDLLLNGGTVTTTSAAAGDYLFGSLAAGPYTVTISGAEFQPGGTLYNWNVVTPTAQVFTFTLAADQVITTADFGLTIPSSYTVTKQLSSVDPTRPGDPISFTIRVTNTGATWLANLPLQDSYNNTFLTYGFGGDFAQLDSDDHTNDGVLNWTDALSVTLGGPGMLAPNASTAITVWFTAREDTQTEGGRGTANRITVTVPSFDPDGAGPLPTGVSLAGQGAAAYVRVYRPTGLTVTGFRALADKGQVTLMWQTVNEANILGFNVLRRTSGSPAQPINAEIILAENAGANQGAIYTFTDKPAAGVYAYHLEVIQLDGRRVNSNSVAVRVGP